MVIILSNFATETLNLIILSGTNHRPQKRLWTSSQTKDVVRKAFLTNYPKEFSFLKRVQGDGPTIGGR
ncbi:hypothetical protein ACQVTS_31755 [Bacillus mycoides]|uniref:hypothetical protein n=1 Tax=Bacillus mycoides TaxID=1405 RepID=UPI003D64F8BF